MVSSLTTKVQRLETATGGRGPGDECPECGGPDDFGAGDSYELVWVDPGGPDDREEFCEACGRQLVVVVGWGDDPS